MDGYNDFGWAVEIDPATKTVLGKRWAMGNFAHENAVVHTNERTAYEGIDAAIDYLYKFIATASQDLSSGDSMFIQVQKMKQMALGFRLQIILPQKVILQFLKV